MTTYLEAAQNTRSEKITLVTIEAVARVKLFTASGSDWTRSVDHFIVGVKDDGIVISDWTFTPETKTLTIVGGIDPKKRNLSVTYRMFFSNAAVVLPYDLDSGVDVEWLPLVTDIGAIGQRLDEQSTGTVLESSSNISMINTSGYFDDKFDTLIWENQEVKFFSWFPNIPITEKVQLFVGVVDSKSFSDSKVNFKVKDFVFKLRNQVKLGTFTELDGIILPSILNTPKRRIYGQVDTLKMVSLDATLKGFLLTGDITVSVGSATLTGVGTSFLSELTPEDELLGTFNGEEIKFGIQSIETDTSLTLGKISDYNLNNVIVKVAPAIPYRIKNRSWSIAGHKLREPSSTALIIISDNTFIVDNVDDFFTGDEITVNGISSKIRRISGSYIVTETVITPTPPIGAVIKKRPVQEVFFGKRRLVYDRDYLITNTTESKITLKPLAEFNLFEQRSLGVSVTFTNGSRDVSTISTLDFRSILKPRDWIRSANLTKSDWYEILEVKEQQIILRTPFIGTTATESAYIKNIEYINEESLMTCNCLGMEDISGQWVKTASDAVRHLVLNDAEFSGVNELKFAKAKSDCDYILSIAIPETIGSKSPAIRDVITKINDSVFGSLYGDSSQNISYSILNATKPELTSIIRDDDIISFSVATTQKIINKVISNYRPNVDVNTGEDNFLIYESDSKFVNDLIGIRDVKEITLYLYNTENVVTMTQRIVLFNSLSNSVITLKTKLNMARVLVNDKIFLSLDRLYKRFAGGDRRKLGTVVGTNIDEYNCEISISDLSNVYNRVPSIAPNSTLDYTSSSEDNILRWGYIVDNDTETANASDESGLGSQIIG